MKNLPDPIKWLIVILALAGMAVMMLAVNDRASCVPMPEPDNTFGVYRAASSQAAE